MLKSLRVRNYILIREMEMNPDSDLVVITGETGAGKSILLGAIGLLLGQRADSKTLFDEDKKCIIEGVFDIRDYNLKPLFQKMEWDYFEDCILRREISPNGRSRAFVNDSPANLNDIKSLGERLLDIHSQHESILINSSTYQLNIIDAYAGNENAFKAFSEAFTTYSETRGRLEKLRAIKSSDEKEKDYKSFLLNELEEAGLKEGEKAQLESQLNIAENAENIHIQLSTFLQIMEASEPNGLQILREAMISLQKVSSFSKELEEIFRRMESTEIEIRDIVDEASGLLQEVDLDAEQLQELRERVNLIQRLEDKHHVQDFDDLLRIREELEKDLEESLNVDEEIQKLEKQLSILESALNENADILSASRKAVKESLAADLKNLLMNLGIAEAEIQINIQEKEITQDGKDKVNILFSANKGQKAVPIREAASGGEMSRLMLALKYLIADKINLPTIIFDEIDTGISGKIAIQMGEMLRKIAAQHQVIAITHLPQIAAKGHMHYVVFKEHGGHKTSTQIRQLSGEERIIEIAQMISGKHDSSSAIESAKELLEHN